MMPTPETRLERSVQDLTAKQSRYDRTRQIAFYTFGLANIVGTILVILLVIQFNKEADRRNDDAAGRSARTQALLQSISEQQQAALNAQTLALEKFFLRAISGETPPPEPLPVFPLPSSGPKTPSAPSASPSPARTVAPRPSATPKPTPRPTASPTPSPTPASICEILGIPNLPAVC